MSVVNEGIHGYVVDCYLFFGFFWFCLVLAMNELDNASMIAHLTTHSLFCFFNTQEQKFLSSTFYHKPEQISVLKIHQSISTLSLIQVKFNFDFEIYLSFKSLDFRLKFSLIV